MNAFEALNAYYSSYNEDERFDKRHNSVEFLTTMDYIRRYLTPGDRILEIGAGSGRYSHALARTGHRVDAVELIPRNIGLFRERTEPGEDVSIRQGTATDLSCFEDGTFDLTLLLGPMYHLFTEEEQRAALSEAARVTKPGGLVFRLLLHERGDGDLLRLRAAQHPPLSREREDRSGVVPVPFRSGGSVRVVEAGPDF